MKIIAGLGNPGFRYKSNRHNVGFILIDKIANEHGLSWNTESKYDALVAKFNNILLVKPQIFMNNSGESISKVVNFYNIDTNDLIIIHDDVDLEFGKVKKQFGISSAGHKGVESIIEKLGSEDFWRIRVGIGRPQNENIGIEDWVLMDFKGDEIKEIMKIDIKDLTCSNEV